MCYDYAQFAHDTGHEHSGFFAVGASQISGLLLLRIEIKPEFRDFASRALLFG